MELKKYYYRAYGLNICSDIPIREFPENESLVDIVIKLSKIKLPLSSTVITQGKNFQVTKDSTYLFWSNIGKFKVSNGKEIIVDPMPHVNFNLLNYFIVGAIMAILLNQRGYLVFHASAINIGGYAIAFLGSSGIGKSTIANALYSKGYGVITDDILPIQINGKNKPLIVPSFPYLKLESKISKYNIEDSLQFLMSKYFNYKNNGFSEKQMKLKRIYIMESHKNTYIDPVSHQESLSNLLCNSYCIKLFKQEEKALNLAQCAEIVNNIPIYKLNIQRSLEALPKVVNLIENDVLTY